jgi:hypothetical protein
MLVETTGEQTRGCKRERLDASSLAAEPLFRQDISAVEAKVFFV